MWVSRLMLAHYAKPSISMQRYKVESVSLCFPNAWQMVSNLHRTYTEHRTISIHIVVYMFMYIWSPLISRVWRDGRVFFASLASHSVSSSVYMDLMGKHRRHENRRKKIMFAGALKMTHIHSSTPSMPIYSTLVLKCFAIASKVCTFGRILRWNGTNERKKYEINKFKRVNSFMMTTHLFVIQ